MVRSFQSKVRRQILAFQLSLRFEHCFAIGQRKFGISVYGKQLFQIFPSFKDSENIVGKGEHAGNRPKREITILAKVNLLSASTFNLVKVKILSVGKELTLYQTTNIRVFQTERVCRRQFQI